MMRRQPLGSERAAVALANAADARNRRTAVVLIAGLVLVAGLIYAGIGWVRHASASSALEIRQQQAQRVDRLFDQIREESLRKTDPLRAYPIKTLVPPRLFDAVEDVWGVDDSTGARIAPIPTVPEIEALNRAPLLDKATIQVGINGQPLDLILRFIETVLSDPQMSNAFISEIELAPLVRGWRATIAFRWYQAKERL